ncbi:pentatricopeptide repeat-containing protein At1g20230-like [Macadamia integrifolia]|uniref:pentatricopeptide repeat-containing protein At1g20230-like n=1 Tax=Macadamia integrifolia TaxID=60698 RepID=UPI001C501651|nr:pentatricopeptide repeat-containing protein At1g20230-like [Macadamia integrifolia]XP_042503996.1 pentatricopeptide repeat-containing protein At1g20230-like [Macadamia integrifolia]
MKLMLAKVHTNLPPNISQKLVKLYLKSGELRNARQLLNKIPEPDHRLWTLLISAFTKQGLPQESLKLYAELQTRNVKPDKLVLLSAIKACAALGDLINAKEIHEDANRYGFCSDLVLGNALIDMYGKCRFLLGACKVFDEMPTKDVISWTSKSMCYVHCGLPREALQVIRQMSLTGMRPNSITVSSILPACSALKDLSSGREIHGFVVRNGMGENVFVSSGLVDMYANCLSMQQAQAVFDNMSHRDTVSWNVILTAHFSTGGFEKGLNIFYQMSTARVKLNSASWNAVISGCIQNGQNEQALELFAQMQDSGYKPNPITVSSVLPACTNLESLRGGKEIHGYTFRHQIMEDVTVATALIFMYAKCGDLELSRRVFDRLSRRDTIAWNTMIMANSMHGNGKDALLIFQKMIDSGVKPNHATFTGVLSGCSHSQLVEEGRLIFNLMSGDYLIEPDADHYSCLVDILSRAGYLEDAYDLIQKMPMEPTANAWGALLGACRVYKNVKLGRMAAHRLFEIEPDNAGNYVLLSNIFVNAKLWGEASQIRKLMRDKGIIKVPGCSWVQVKNRVYTFVVGDKRNDQSGQIYKFLDEMGEKMKLAGYSPDTDFVLQDVDQEEKEEVLCNHSERLAVAFGILNLNGGLPVRVFKNLRICRDCHNVIKFMSKIVGIQITVRDSLRFHHFRSGLCSCKDFW